MSKQISKLAQVRAAKGECRAAIDQLQRNIMAALDPSRVPDRILHGDIITVQSWKACLEKGPAADHYICAAPPPNASLRRLTEIRVRLEAVLNRLV